MKRTNHSDWRITNTEEVVQCRVVRWEYLNDQGKLFGGDVLKWMDEVAYLAASRFTGQVMVTAAIEKVKFRQAIPPGSWITVKGKVVDAGAVRVTVSVEVIAEKIPDHPSGKAVDGIFTFVAVDETGHLIRVTRAGDIGQL
ncbi:MAG TPA: acyl-CoA thioesterase [Bacteroidales bacterium]|nr:acyl-CoA thioesterase [Bacteroidales bacterium]